MNRYVSKKDKITVRERADWCCEYCKAFRAYATSLFCSEHIIPLVLGGGNELENLAYSCDICNINKATKTTTTDLKTGKEIPLLHPRKDNWYQHFKWSDDSLHIIGITLKGELTIQTLDMNREELVNLRKALKALDVHPPKPTNHHSKNE